MYKDLRFWLAVLFAPVVSIVVSVIFVTLTTGSAADWMRLDHAVRTTFLVLAVAYSGTIIIGVPIHLLLRHINRNSFLAHTIAGGFLALVPVVVSILLVSGPNADHRGAIWIGLCTLAVASTFGLIANWPNKKIT